MFSTKRFPKFKYLVILSNVSKEVTSSNPKQLERPLDELTIEFLLCNARNLGYYTLEIADGKIMSSRMKFENKFFSRFSWANMCVFKYVCFLGQMQTHLLLEKYI